MRAFLAAELPEDWRHRLSAARLRVPDAAQVRWVAWENLHLTLAFFEDLDPTGSVELEAGLDGVVATQPRFPWRLGVPGVFPEHGRVRVLWVGIESVELQAFAERVREIAAPFVAPRERVKPFRPHVTVGRCDPPCSEEESRRLCEAFAGVESEPDVLAEIALFRSELRRGGPRYQVLERFRLS